MNERLRTASPTGFAPAAQRASNNPVLANLRTVAAWVEGRQTHLWHPVDDVLSIVERGGSYPYRLRVRHGAVEYGLTDQALEELAARLQVSAALLARLRTASDVDLGQLLSALLRSRSNVRSPSYRIVTEGTTVQHIYPATFVAVDLDGLIEVLEEAEAAGSLSTRFAEGNPDALWIACHLPRLAPFDLRPGTVTEMPRADLWQPGVAIINVEHKGRAARVVPSLFRAWGHLTLPLVEPVAGTRARRHAGGTSSTLLDGLVHDLTVASNAPFAELATRLQRLQGIQVPRKALDDYLAEPALRLPTQAARDAARDRVLRGRPTAFRIVTAVLTVAREIEDPARRLDALMAASRYVWSRGRHAREPQRREPDSHAADGAGDDSSGAEESIS